MNRRSGSLLLTVIISLAISLVVFLTVFNVSKPGRSGAVPEGTLKRAAAIECQSRLRAIQTAITIFAHETGSNPESPAAVPELAGQELVCPVTRSPYIYDRETGTIRCPDH